MVPRQGNILLRSKSTRRYFSGSINTSPTVTVEGTAQIASSGPGVPREIVRHGPGDAVICLNVGGTKFQTLRSTVASNKVLNEYICRAEANGELTGEKEIFIDRDPTYFAFILTFLRNRIEGVSYNSSRNALARTTHGVVKSPKYVEIPHDAEVIKHLFVETTHYQIFELQDQLCSQSILVSFMATFSGGNPFEAAAQWIKNLQRTAIALVGGGSILTGLNLVLDEMPFFKKLLRKGVEDHKPDAVPG